MREPQLVGIARSRETLWNPGQSEPKGASVSNPKRLRLLLVPLLAMFALAAAAGAAGSPPTSVSGSVGNTSATFNSIRAAGDNLFIDVTGTAAYTGSLVGTSTINGTLILHADGSASYHDTEVFTGTVNGVAGVLTFNLNGYNSSDLAVHATATIVGATGGLAGSHGVLHEVQTVVLPTGPVGTYSGQIG
jgi:Protein of unknown function (DUF3224)